MRIGFLGVAKKVAEVLRGGGHDVAVLPRLPTRHAARALDLLLVCGYPSRIGVDVFAAPRLGTWNVHPSLLPSGRGPQPVRWAILRGDEWIGVTIHQMTSVIDGGPIWWQERVVLGELGHAAALSALLDRAAHALPSLVRGAEAGGPGPVSQPDASRPGGGRAEGRVPPALLRLDPTLPLEVFRRRVAANDDRGSALDGPRGIERLVSTHHPRACAACPGVVLDVDGTAITFAVGGGALTALTLTTPRARVGDVLRPVVDR